MSCNLVDEQQLRYLHSFHRRQRRVLNELQLSDHDCHHHSLHLWNSRDQPNRDINDLVHGQLGNLKGQLNSLIMGICLCFTTGMLKA